MLDDTADRDADQVVSRWSPSRDPECPHNILMVDQLWLWATCEGHPGTHGKGMERKNLDQATLPSDDQASESTNKKPRQHYVITSFPSRHGSCPPCDWEHDYRRTHDDLRQLVLDPVSRERNAIVKTEDLVSRILETCCSVFDRWQNVEPLQFLQMFAKAIGTTVSRLVPRLIRSPDRKTGQ